MSSGTADWKGAKDSWGFSVLPTGYRTTDGNYFYPHQIAGFWTPDVRNSSEAYAYIFPFFTVSMGYMKNMAVSWDQGTDNNGGVLYKSGLSVRCVKDYIPSGD